MAMGVPVIAPSPAWPRSAEITREPSDGFNRQITVTRYKSRTLQLRIPFASAVVGSPDIADVMPMSDHVLYVQGKKIGTTNVALFDNEKKLISVIDLEVTIDIQEIRDKIRAGTESPAIQVSARNEQVFLSGEARNAVDAQRAVEIAKAMVMPVTPDGKTLTDPEKLDKYVVNLMHVAATQQVMLRVRFVEVDRSAERDLGVNWFYSRNGVRGINTGNGGSPSSLTQAGPIWNSTAGSTLGGTATPGGVPLFQTIGTFASATAGAPFGVGLFNLVKGGISADVLISALEEKGLARKLAEPDLVALSGDKASFLAGGSYPVPSVQSSSGTVPVITTQYQPYGVELNFIPTVAANGIINLQLEPKVSELDYANGVSISGTIIPGLTVRQARTTIELRDGQSFAIAGLLQSDSLRDISQLPWIGSVPVLGMLARSSSYSQKESDLVVIVTPHLVAPAVPGQKLATPFDKDLPANDVDFFVMGKPDVRKQYTEFVTSGGGLQGPYGHIMPLEQEPQ